MKRNEKKGKKRGGGVKEPAIPMTVWGKKKKGLHASVIKAARGIILAIWSLHVTTTIRVNKICLATSRFDYLDVRSRTSSDTFEAKSDELEQAQREGRESRGLLSGRSMEIRSRHGNTNQLT